MRTHRPSSADRNLEFRAVAVKFERDYRKKRALQVVTSKNIGVGEERSANYSMKFLLE